MKNMSENQAKRIEKVQFRWPIHQMNDTTVEVEIPLKQGEPLVILNEIAADELHLSAAEFEAAKEAATTAVIQSIMIVK